MDLDIKRYLDENGRITLYPKKQASRLAILSYAAEKFEYDVIYTERQINEICDNWFASGDHFLLRRELIDFGFLGREKDGSKYWRLHVDDDKNED